MSPLIPGGYAYLEDSVTEVTGVVATILVIVKTSTKLKINQTLSMLKGCLTTTISGNDRMSVSIDVTVTSLICKPLLDADQCPHTSLSLVSSLARSLAQLRQGKARQATVSPFSSKYNPRVILFSGFAFFAKTCVWVRISQKISGKKVKNPKFRSSFRIPAGSGSQIFLQHPKPEHKNQKPLD